MPSGGKNKRRKSSQKKSELDSALGQISDESVAAAKKEFQDLLAQAKGDTTELVRQNAEELEERLVLLKKRKIDKEDFDHFVANQKRDLRGLYRQPAGAGAGTRREINAPCSGDSCEGGDRTDLAAASPSSIDGLQRKRFMISRNRSCGSASTR